jgi:hypothetical protein
MVNIFSFIISSLHKKLKKKHIFQEVDLVLTQTVKPNKGNISSVFSSTDDNISYLNYLECQGDQGQGIDILGIK